MAEHARTRCLRCDNSGYVMEWRLTWKTTRHCSIPEPHARRVESEQSGVEQFHALLGQAEAAPGSILDVDLVSEARKCACRKPGQPDSTEPESDIAALATAVEPPRQHGTNHRQPFADRKMAQAGDRE